MKKIIRRKLFVSKEDKKYGKYNLELAEHWINTADKVKDDEHFRSICLKNSAIYLNRAVRYLGFKTADDMYAYYEKHKRF